MLQRPGNSKDSFSSKESLDDAFKSLEKLLHVLQGEPAHEGDWSSSEASPRTACHGDNVAAAAGGDLSPWQPAWANSTAGSGVASELGLGPLPRIQTPQPTLGTRGQAGTRDFSGDSLFQAPGLFTPGRERSLSMTLTPLAWEAEKARRDSDALPASSANTTADTAAEVGFCGSSLGLPPASASTTAEVGVSRGSFGLPPTSAGTTAEASATWTAEVGLSGTTAEATSATLTAEELAEVSCDTSLTAAEHAEVVATLHRRDAELAEVKALWVEERDQLQRLLQQQEKELEELKAGHANDVCQLPEFLPAEKADGHSDACVQCDMTSEPLRSYEEELCRMSALLQAGSEELSSLRHQHEEELEQMRVMLGAREEELAALKAQQCVQAASHKSASEQLGEVQAALREKEEESLKLTTELRNKNWALQRLHTQQEKELEDCTHFLKRIALSSSSPILGLTFDLGTAEVLGMGNYGFIITCKSLKSGERVVVKLQGARWAGVAVKEWAHGSELSRHSHIVSYLEAIMHRDAGLEIQNHLKAGFDHGILTRRRPKFFPDCFFCLALEYMDRGTVQNFMDRHPLTPECVGAITRQVASALAFMHKGKRTHNDIKPENILLREAPRGDCLVAKLADLGLADHSLERKRDQELFGYTVWCMGIRERFERIPAVGRERDFAVTRFRREAPTEKRRKDLWEVLAKVVAEMWEGSLDMVEVERMDKLANLQITLPETEEEASDLEASAKLDLQRRIDINWRAHKWRQKAKACPDLLFFDENLGKIADSDPDEEVSDVETEPDESMSLAKTWPATRKKSC